VNSQPITVKVTRYKCPCCGRTAANRSRAAKHIGNCWLNPEAKGCKTCKHFEPAWSEPPDWVTGFGGAGDQEQCNADVDLSGRPACDDCHGKGTIWTPGGFSVHTCPQCGGDGAEVKPGPIVHCDKWERSADARLP
jgi:hypothetical protein